MVTAEPYEYEGSELNLFAAAVCWKRYFGSFLKPHLSGDVLEVGAGLGGTIPYLCTGNETSWTCLEPDPQLAAQIEASAQKANVPLTPRVIVGTLADCDPQAERFDSILYIDVLEHIEDDATELNRAAELLKPGGTLLVLCPAHQYLFTAFDEAIGHWRRYNRSMFRAVAPQALEEVRIFYLDACGLMLSLGNRLLLHSSSPTANQIRLWDRVFVRCSRIVDCVTRYRIGKTVVAVWRKPTEN